MKAWLHIDLPVTDYVEAWNLQKNLLAARIKGRLNDDVVISLEHPSVFTVGRRGGRENLTVSEDFLNEKGIPIVDIERGGDITFHGPGQIVVYPIVNLERAGLGIGEYITSLEDLMIRTSAEFGVEPERSDLNRGVWIGKRKLGNIGICVRRGIAFHGLSLNVNLSLEPFGWINPCGLQGIEVTSLEKELSSAVPMDQVRSSVKRNIEQAFNVHLVETSLSDLLKRIETEENAARQDAASH